MGTISGHQLSTFASPVNGTTPIDANTVRGNDNTIKTSYNAHDADTTIHLQNGLVASRPAASIAGQMWLASDASAVYAYLDTGSAWVEWNYLRNTGGTVTGNVAVTGTLTVTGATTLNAATSITSAVTGLLVTYSGAAGANTHVQLVRGSTTVGYLGADASDNLTMNRGDGAVAVTVNRTTSAVTFAGTVALNNTVNAVSPTSPNRTVTISIGGTTYYLAAKTTND